MTRRAKILATRILIIFLLLAIWEILARFFVDKTFISPPSVVVFSYGKLFQHEGLTSALLTLLVELATAFSLAVVIST